MTQAARQRNFGLLATDGKPHKAVDILTAITLVVGVASLIMSLFHHLHVPAAWTGLVGIASGGWAQMISATTRERFGIVLGLGAAGLGFFLAMARGGLFGGVLG